MNAVVVVESPAKAKTIEKYLGKGYEVLASYGHVRDLPAKDGSVDPDQDFRMVWELLAEKKKRVDEIVRRVKDADRLYLATDPDREGEAISWHLLSVLKDRRAAKSLDVKRVVFHEITKRAVAEAFEHARDIDDHLVDAYQARRALDYLVGFTLSPVLWRKLPGSRSAGRVQSVALRLICEREDEIEAFRPQEYWTVEAEFTTPRNQAFTARLIQLDGRKLEKFSLANEEDAKRAVAAIEARDFAVASVERKQVQRHPAPPFSTSTLQQEASRKLGFGASRTMSVAQRLFEGVDLGGETVGLITYMRTDSVQLSNEAVDGCRRLIGERYGPNYLPPQPRRYTSKAKNAQEAHEAIRPTDMARTPDRVARYLDDDQRRLYELIWKRTLACQMASAIMDRVTIEVASRDGQVGLRATGTTIAFDGFIKVYREGRDDQPEEDEAAEGGRLLPPVERGEALRRGAVTPAQHFTEPPPRYTEASLVKMLEEVGVGRPSTYAQIISVLQDRNYVRLESKRFVPEDRGRLVSAFLAGFFDRYVQPGFTAQLEDQLDDIAAGTRDWKDVLRAFWEPFHDLVDEVQERRTADIIEALNELLAPQLFPATNGGDPRACPACGEGRLSLKVGRYGAFIGCSNYPECRYTRPFGAADGAAGERGSEEAAQAAAAQERRLGLDPETGQEVWLKQGRFGPYVQRGEGEAARRSSLPRGLGPDDVDLETALRLLALPRELGTHPETGQPVSAGIGRYGPYLKHGPTYVNLGPEEDVLTVGMNRALTLLEEAQSRRRTPKTLRELGPHPKGGEPVTVLEGRFGPYVKHGKVNATLPKGVSPENLTMERAVELLAAKAGKGKAATKAGRGGSGAARKAAGANGESPATKATAKPRKPGKTAAGTAAAKPTRSKGARGSGGAARGGT